MEALTLTRKDYVDGLTKSIAAQEGDKSYLDRFEIKFLDGINTASTLEICRLLQSPDLESKIKIMKLCIEGRNVEVKCPNGEIEKFCLGNKDDSIEGFDLFKKEPLALIAISDAIYGYILKKSIRLSRGA